MSDSGIDLGDLNRRMEGAVNSLKNDLAGLRAEMFGDHPSLARIDQIEAAEWTPVEGGEIGEGGFESPISDHYMTNPIARASAIMADLSRLAAERKNAKLAAE